MFVMNVKCNYNELKIIWRLHLLRFGYLVQFCEALFVGWMSLNENTAAESDRGLFFLFPQKCSEISSKRKPVFLLTLVLLKAAVVSSNDLGLQLNVNQASHFAIFVSMGSIN